MGHEIGYNDYPGTMTQKEVFSRIAGFAYDPNESSGYHGNLTFHTNRVYQDYEAAEEAIKGFDTGWYSDHAVLYNDYREWQIEDNAKIKNLDARIARYRESKKKIFDDSNPRNQKARMISCKRCGSKFPKEYAYRAQCPVCNETLLSKTTQNRLTKIDENITECIQKKKEEKRRLAMKKKPEVRWLVKYEFHC